MNETRISPKAGPKITAAPFGDIDHNGADPVTAEAIQAFLAHGHIKVFDTINADCDGIIRHEAWHRLREAHGRARH